MLEQGWLSTHAGRSLAVKTITKGIAQVLYNIY